MTDATIDRPAPVPTGASPDKREAILAAALRLIARLGLHASPMSAVAREAGVAAGTLYLYFESKEAMINALYLELLEDRTRAIVAPPPPPPPSRHERRVAHGPAQRALAGLVRSRPLGARPPGGVEPHRPVPAL